MSGAGGDRSNVKVVPFGTKSVVPSDYSHLKDFSTMNFAMELGKDHADPRKKGKIDVEDVDEGEDWGDDEDVDSKPRKKTGKKQTLVDPEDLQNFLQAEGVDPEGENLCPLPKCMEVISKIILNDKNAKIEKADIMAEIEAMNAMLNDSLRDEEKAQQQLVGLTKEQQGLERTVEQQKEKVKALETKKDDLEVEKKTFNGKMGVLERDERNWGAKLKAAQTKFAKIIWLKPGQTYNDDEGHLQMDIHTIRASTAKDLDDISVPATVDYNKLAAGAVSDFNERTTGPLYYSRYVEDTMKANEDLQSVATTSKLAFLQKKSKIRQVKKSSAGAAGEGAGMPEQKDGDGDNGSVVSALTIGGSLIGGVGGGRGSPTYIKQRPEAQSVKNVREYLMSSSAKRMVQSPSKGTRGGSRAGGGGIGPASLAPPSIEAGTAPERMLSSQSVGPAVGGGAGGAVPSNATAARGAGIVAATGLLDRSTLERMSLVSSSMGRSGNKNPASVIGSPVRALQALRSANAAREAQPHQGGPGTVGRRSPSPVSRRMRGHSHSHSHSQDQADDMKSINTMSTLGADASVFSLEEHQAMPYADGASFAHGEQWEAGGVVGGSLVASNRNYGTRRDRGKIRTIQDGVGTLNYKARSVRDMLEDIEFN